MSTRKVKTSPKLFVSDTERLQDIIVKTLSRANQIVGATLGPAGKTILIESDYPGIPNKQTKDGVTVFRSLGSNSSYEHLILEEVRAAAQRTATEAGDGTTTATVLSATLIRLLFDFCNSNPNHSPQKTARELSKIVRERLVPAIKKRSIPITIENQQLLKMVAKISANGDEDLASAVIEAFETIGYGDSSHVTIKEVSGPYGYEVSTLEGFPIPIGYEESIGKFHTAFINDQSNQRISLEDPLFLLFDGAIADMMSVQAVLERAGEEYASGRSEFKNIVIFSHGYSDSVLTSLAFNMANPSTINVIPMQTPAAAHLNAKLHFLNDLAAFTGAKVFGLKDRVADATPADLGSGMTHFECYRFRSTIVGVPDELNINVRADQLKVQKENAESASEKIWIEERLGKLTSGIAKLTIYGGSTGEMKERADRAEDAVMAVRSSIKYGALPGGARVFLDLALELQDDETAGDVAHNILVPALITPFYRLLENAGYTDEQSEEIMEKLSDDPSLVYDIENQVFGKAEDLGLFDCAPAVTEALLNATGIATVLGTCGGIVAYPRDAQFEREEAAADEDYRQTVSNPTSYRNEANERA